MRKNLEAISFYSSWKARSAGVAVAAVLAVVAVNSAVAQVNHNEHGGTQSTVGQPGVETPQNAGAPCPKGGNKDAAKLRERVEARQRRIKEDQEEIDKENAKARDVINVNGGKKKVQTTMDRIASLEADIE